MKEIKAFITSDEKIFCSQDEARVHEEYLQIYPVIDAFLESQENTYRGVPQRAIARRAIAMWEQWKDKNI